jgi:hypothetical protein
MENIAKPKTQKQSSKGGGSLFQGRVIFLWVFLFFLMGLTAGFAEVAVIQSPLSWYEGGSGKYALPKLIGDEYSLSEFVSTEGQVKTICVNYEAAGKISVEVSADNGLHYYVVINGVPLEGGFVSSDRLRWRAKTLSDDAKLYSLKIAYTDTAGVMRTFGQPELSGFKYRKPVFIQNSGKEILYNYQIKINLGESQAVKEVDLNCANKTLADFKDIRFTASDAQTPLPYYRENIEGPTGSRKAVFWVKVPQIPQDGITFYLYYGNADAEDLSDANKTFDFFEDFSASQLDKNKWVLHVEPKGSAIISLGKMKLDAAEIISKDFKFQEGIIEYSSFVETGFENSLNIRNKVDDSYDIPIWLAYASAYKGAEHCIAVDGVVKINDGLAKPQAPGAFYNYRLNVLGGKIIFERFDSLAKELQASVTYQLDPKNKTGYLGLHSGGDGDGKNIVNFGTLRVRKPAETLPIIEGSGKEETVALPVFVDTAISEKGQLVLKAAAKSGYYITADIICAEPARIIIPNWNTDSDNKLDFDLGFSADKGLTYKSNCEKGKFYYASKKDFSPGNDLKVRVDLSGSSNSQANSGLASLALDYRLGRINIIAPNGGEVITQGSQREITWSAQDYEPSYPVNIEYSTDAGKNYTLIAGNLANSGDYLWTAAGDSQRVLVKVADANDASIFDVSDKVFNVAATEESSTSDYLGGNGKWNNAAAWSDGNIPGLGNDVQIASGVTIYADEPVSFRTLSIGDGQGKVTTTVVLKAGVNSGSGEIIIRKGGKLIQDGQEPIVITGNLSVKSGGILSHLPKSGINITAKNINLEPGSKVDAEAKNKHAGGTVNLSASGDFNIFGTITADGDKQKGGKGGAIYLTAGKFGGENALITADGGYSKTKPDNYGIFIPKGAGTISGLVSTSSGDN